MPPLRENSSKIDHIYSEQNFGGFSKAYTLYPVPPAGAHDRMQGLKRMFKHEKDNFESMRC